MPGTLTAGPRDPFPREMHPCPKQGGQKGALALRLAEASTGSRVDKGAWGVVPFPPLPPTTPTVDTLLLLVQVQTRSAE